ncbi:hypothetical protein K445DRAFT_304537 [Daldinia sp. EC12]|nr:hypothetical protein K445DRAFT_304537 [Daldinia sp. EC12]
MDNVTSSIESCCLSLSLLLKGMVSFPGSLAYTASLASYFTLQMTDIRPSCIVSPTTADDVSTAIHVLTSGGSSPPLCKFAIRSGGHSTSIGASNIQDGVTIDLRNLNTISLSPDKSIASIGVGNTWGTVYSNLDELNLSVVGGRTSSVGVGGLTLGGGISYFGPRYGWTFDTVTNFEIVLANGSIVHANNDENTNLFWALHGGANNFGVVTRIDIQSFDQSEFWDGISYHATPMYDEEIAALSEFSMRAPYDEFASLIGTFGYSAASGPFIANSIEYTKNEPNPLAFRRILSIPSVNSTLRVTNMTDLAVETETQQMIGERAAYATATIHPTNEAIDAALRAWNSSLSSIRDIAGIIWSISLEPLPPSIYARYSKDNALGLHRRQDDPLLVILLSVIWSKAKDDNKIEREMKALIHLIEKEAEKLGALDPFLYLNYAASWQNPIASYGETSVSRLRRVQREYDPTGIFANHVPGGFKIPNQGTA